MSNLDAILSKTAEAEPPKQLPPGDFFFEVIKPVGFTDEDALPASQAGNSQVYFEVMPIASVEPLDPSVFDPSKLSLVKMRLYFTLTETALYRLKDFLTHLGWDSNNTPALDFSKNSTGRRFRGTVVQAPPRNPKPGQEKQMFSSIAATFPAS